MLAFLFNQAINLMPIEPPVLTYLPWTVDATSVQFSQPFLCHSDQSCMSTRDSLGLGQWSILFGSQSLWCTAWSRFMHRQLVVSPQSHKTFRVRSLNSSSSIISLTLVGSTRFSLVVFQSENWGTISSVQPPAFCDCLHI